jgi:PEP-CTERM motif
MNVFKISSAAVLLALATCGAQAARLQLVDGTASTFGNSLTQLGDAGGNSLSFSGAADDLSGLAEVFAFGAASHGGTLPISGLAFTSDWVRQATLDASGAVTRFQATGSTSLGFSGTADLSEAIEQASVGLGADLLVASEGEAEGTPVQVRLQLSANSLFNSTLAGADDTPTFNLLVLDATFSPLASYNGLALNSSNTLDVSFASAVGQTLSFSLSYANTLGIGNSALAGMHTVSSSALLDGMLSVAAVPEPRSLALLLAGLGVVATVAGRRK